MLAGAHKKFYRIQHPKIYLLDLKVQYKHKMKLPLDMISKLPCRVSLRLHADDTTEYFAHHLPMIVEYMINSELNTLSEWFNP